MARGRMLSAEISRDKKVNNLSNPWSMLGFTWLIAHLDCEGRTYGDPALVRAIVFPRQPQITVEQMESYIQEWEDAGLIERYEADGDSWISFPNFDKHQPGLRKDRESASTIPAPPIRNDDGNLPDELPPDSGIIPAEDGLKFKLSLREVEVEEEVEDAPPASPLLAAFINATKIPEFGPNTLEHIHKMITAGVEPEDIAVAVAEMDAKGLSITGIKSIVNPAILVAGRRRRSNGRDSPGSQSLQSEFDLLDNRTAHSEEIDLDAWEDLVARVNDNGPPELARRILARYNQYLESVVETDAEGK